MPEQQGHNGHDDAFRQATKVVVDDALRTDVLGPRICAVLSDHTPAGNKIRELIAEAIVKEPSIIDAIETLVDNFDRKRKIKWIERGIGAFGGALVSILAGLVLYGIEHWPSSTPTMQIQQIPATYTQTQMQATQPTTLGGLRQQ